MNLTEPHCGTDLGLIKTRAVPNGDGSHAIFGTKIFISSGEHDLASNIIHLVLARIEGAPPAPRASRSSSCRKSSSTPMARSASATASPAARIEHKMGIHGNATCVMNYDGAKGFLIGQENKGLNAMFVMMNEARLGVGVQGLAQSEVAYQNAAAYAKERLQGRALTGPKDPDKPADPILVHPDVRRVLMSIKRLQRGGARLRALDGAQGRCRRIAPTMPRTARRPRIISGLMTPIVKGVLTDVGFANAVKAQQIFGGHGYIAE